MHRQKEVSWKKHYKNTELDECNLKGDRKMLMTIIDDVNKSLKAGAYISALSLTLTIPDICGKAEYGDIGNKRRYINWYDEYMPLVNSTPTDKKSNSAYIIAITLLTVFLFFFGFQCYQYYQLTNEHEEELSRLRSQLAATKRENTNYETILENADSASNTNFFVSNTVLKNPNKTRVVFYINSNENYNISWEYSNDITLTTGNTSSGLVYIDVTYNGNGVGTIECTNSVNSQKITIYCIGGN